MRPLFCISRTDECGLAYLGVQRMTRLAIELQLCSAPGHTRANWEYLEYPTMVCNQYVTLFLSYGENSDLSERQHERHVWGGGRCGDSA